jgi:hypothetical protein
MSYRTNPKALRLGIAHDWNFKTYGPSEQLHLDLKLQAYVTNMIQFAVPQAPPRAKTKGRAISKFAVSPGIQGRTLVLRGSNSLHLMIFFYLNYDGAEAAQLASFHRNFGLLREQLQRESEVEVELSILNYFLFFWRLEIFAGIRTPLRVRRKVGRCISRHAHLQMERLAYSSFMPGIRYTRRALRSFRRERYFTRTFSPLLAAFAFGELDADIAARAVALELQMLRIYHRRFLRYVRRFMALGFSYWNRRHMIEGLTLEVRGRTTDHRRQVARASVKTMRFGVMKRSDLRRESGHCRYLAFNRYGVLSVSITYALRSVVEERWEDRSPVSPLRAFALRELLELHAETLDVGPTPTQRAVSLRLGEALKAAPRILVTEEGSLRKVITEESIRQDALERYNRCYGEQRSEFQRSLDNMHPMPRALLRMRPVLVNVELGFGRAREADPARVTLGRFMRQLP